MKEKFLKIYMNIFTVIVYFTSLFGFMDLLEKVGIFKDSTLNHISNYIFLIIYSCSFVCMIFYSDKYLIDKDKKNNDK